MENIVEILKEGIPTYDVQNDIIQQWQELVDVAAKLMDVPACVIMRLDEKNIEAFVTSEGEDNPFVAGNGLTFYGSGIYCETVIQEDRRLYVHNASKEKEFENCPEIGLGLTSYLGYPINHQSGMPFGTLCVYDRKERNYSEKQEHLILQIKNMLENNLKLLKTTTDLQEAQEVSQDAINYASQIQKSLLPKENIFLNFFKDSFIVWRPKDSVGGDIYFVNQLSNDEIIIILVDCTGHGVAAAMITMIVKTIQEQITASITANGLLTPGEILSIFNIRMKQVFDKENDKTFDCAGFDGAVVHIKKDTLVYAGAKLPLYTVTKDGQVEQIKPDRVSIGYRSSKSDFVFTQKTLSLKEYTKFYLSSDGYWDQIGGKQKFCFGKSKFEKLIKDNHNKSFPEQKDIFVNTLNSYMDGESQIDDISILAFNIQSPDSSSWSLSNFFKS